MYKKIIYISLGFFCFASILLQIESSAWFRIYQANVYKNNYKYGKAILLYDKILNKEKVKKKLNVKMLSQINFDLGNLYPKIHLENLAIESYAEVNADILEDEISRYLLKNNFKQDRLLGLGLLEAGRWGILIKELEKLRKHHPSFIETINKYIGVATVLKNKNLSCADKNFYYEIGDAYIQNQLFEDARAFYTKRILDYGLKPLDVLTYLREKYAEDAETIEKVWGKDIYVTLEDFETIEPRLFNWISNMNGKINNHQIADEVAYKGHYSEFFDITYALDKAYVPYGSTYLLVKLIDIPLENTNPNIGLRLFIKSISPFDYHLRLNIIYPASDTSGTYGGHSKQDIGDGWKEYAIENLFGKAKTVALDRNCSMDGMKADKVIIDTSCISTKFFVDEIQLYLVKNYKAED